jgi:hypothetical protein
MSVGAVLTTCHPTLRIQTSMQNFLYILILYMDFLSVMDLEYCLPGTVIWKGTQLFPSLVAETQLPHYITSAELSPTDLNPS